MSETKTPWQAPLPAELRRFMARSLVPDMILPDIAEAAPPTLMPPAPPAAERGTADEPVTRDWWVVLAEREAGQIGLQLIDIPGFAHPLWFRAGTEDAMLLRHALARTAEDLHFPFVPRRILDIGAKAGYRSLELARLNPDTLICAIEGDPHTARLLALNTLPNRQITPMPCVLAHPEGRFAYEARNYGPGRPMLQRAAQGHVAGVSLATLCGRLGWDRFDVLIADPACCFGLFDDPAAPFLTSTRLIAVKLPPEGELDAALFACCPEATHVHRISGDYALFFRREVAGALPAPRKQMFVDAGGRSQVMRLHDVSPEPWGFFMIGDSGFRLHPNSGGAPDAVLAGEVSLAGPRQFSSVVRVGHQDAGPVRFKIAMESAAGEPIFEADIVVGGGQAQNWVVDLPLHFGPAMVRLATAMANPEQGNGMAWAEWLDPGFT